MTRKESGGPSGRVRLNIVQVGYGDEESPAARLERVGKLIRSAPAADLVVLPELWTAGGFAYEHWVERAEPLGGAFTTALSALARETGAVVHGGSFIENVSGKRYNTSVVFGRDGSLLTVYRKMHRFGVGEKTLLAAGETLVTSPIETAASGPAAVAGLATCYDLRFPELFRALVDAGCVVFLVPAAWPAARVAHWRTLGRARAIENQAFVVQCNTVGTHSGLAMGGYSQVVGPTGVVLAEAGTEEEVLSLELELAHVTELRRDFDVLADRLLPVATTTPRTDAGASW